MQAALRRKTLTVIPFILSRLKEHRAKHSAPFFVGLNGVQGVGKTTLVETLQHTLSSPPHNHQTLALSIDDLYLPFDAQTALANAHPKNPLIQHRGQPSTHDVSLLTSLFRRLKARERDIKVPAYDKSAHNGRGDRIPEEKWRTINSSSSARDGENDGKRTIDVVIFEGWCVGFRPLPSSAVESKWRGAIVAEDTAKAAGKPPLGRLGFNRLQEVMFINDALGEYSEVADMLDAFVFLDAEDTSYVYDWRLEQEVKLRKKKGEDSAMSDDRVREFVDGYYPAYELWTEGLRKGVFQGEGKQLRLVVDRERRVVHEEVT